MPSTYKDTGTNAKKEDGNICMPAFTRGRHSNMQQWSFLTLRECKLVLMCHALVAVIVSDTEGVQVSTRTLTGVGIHRDVIEEFQREYTFYLATIHS